MKAMKGSFLKKLNILSTIKKGRALDDKIPARDDSVPDLSHSAKGLEDDHDDDDDSSSVESVHGFEDANLSAPESLELSLSDAEVSTDSDTCSPREVDRPSDEGSGVVFYSTSLRGIRKTFDDCSQVRFLLRSLKVRFEEKDVSMHRDYRDEMWKLLGGERAVPPKLFIRGRLVGGADEVIGLHEQGELRELLQGIPLDSSTGSCGQCGNFRFIICSSCSGSCRIVVDTGKRVECTMCNENGLVRCPIC